MGVKRRFIGIRGAFQFLFDDLRGSMCLKNNRLNFFVLIRFGFKKFEPDQNFMHDWILTSNPGNSEKIKKTQKNFECHFSIFGILGSAAEAVAFK